MKTVLFSLIMGLSSFSWAQSFEGMWSQDCRVVDDDIEQISIQVHGDEWTWQGVGFDQEDCQSPYLLYQETYQAKKSEPITRTDVALDLQTIEVSYTPLTDEVAESLSLISFCGHSDWKSQVKTVVTGETCEDRSVRRSGEMYFQKAGFNEAGLAWGQLTDSLDGSSVDRRPVDFEARPFHK